MFCNNGGGGEHVFWYCQCIWPGVTQQIISFGSFIYLVAVTPDRPSDLSLPRCQTNCLIDCNFDPSDHHPFSFRESCRRAKQYSLGFVMGKFVSRASMLPLIKLSMQLHWNDIGLLLKSPSKLSIPYLLSYEWFVCPIYMRLLRLRYLNALKHRLRVPCLILAANLPVERIYRVRLHGPPCSYLP